MSVTAKRVFDLTYLLKPLAHKPHSHPTLYTDDVIVVVKDKHPKSDTLHQLILPRISDAKEAVPRSIGEVRRRHLPLLYAMQDYYKSRLLGTESHAMHEGDRLKIGFHALPSIPFLHAHIIDTQGMMQAPFTRLKKHYNSFTTDFFIDLSQAIHDLEGTSIDSDSVNEIIGKSSVVMREREHYEQCLKGILKCTIGACREERRTLGELRKHHQQAHFMPKGEQ